MKKVYLVIILIFFYRKFPSILEYFSYNFCFLTILAGPTCTYIEFNKMVSGENFQACLDYCFEEFVVNLNKSIIHNVNL